MQKEYCGVPPMFVLIINRDNIADEELRQFAERQVLLALSRFDRRIS